MFSGEILKKIIITLQALRFKLKWQLNSLNQTCISSKSIMQLIKTIFPDSVIFIEKKRVEKWLWAKSEFLWAKKNIHCLPSSHDLLLAYTTNWFWMVGRLLTITDRNIWLRRHTINFLNWYSSLSLLRNFFPPSVFNFFRAKGAFFSDPLSFSPHNFSKFRVRHETCRCVYGMPPTVLG